MTRPHLRDKSLSRTGARDAADADTPLTGDNKLPFEILTAKEASAFLWQCFRLQRSERRLAQLRGHPVGAGPPFHRDGCAVRYRRASLIEWAQKQLGREHGNTSAEQAFHQSNRTAA